MSDTEKSLLADYPEHRIIGRLPGTDYLVFEHRGDLFSIQGSVVCRMAGRWKEVKPYFSKDAATSEQIPKEHWHNTRSTPIWSAAHVRVCPQCKGTGRPSKDESMPYCSVCKGRSFVPKLSSEAV